MPFAKVTSAASALIVLASVLIVSPALALETVKIADDIYAFVGEMEQRSPENLANNATFGLIVSADGCVLIDPGGSWKGAEALHAAIRTVTDQPVRYVVDTGGQDHRWLGNGYWRAEGAEIIASDAAVADQRERASLQLSMLGQLIGTALDGTEPVYASTTFADRYELTISGRTIEIRHAGPAHTPGDSFVWVPAQSVVFSGDIIYLDRLLGVMPHSDSRSWMRSFEAIAVLDPAHVVPGHGYPAGLDKARAETYDYLANLRAGIKAHLDAGGDMIGAAKVDQAAFAGLKQFKALAGRNAQQVYAEMEFE
ncbi:MAG: MBL fold metallo-hydrolase [Hyphomicrobiales bacterium]|nr:MBL fold metallo-hydrolase [Hyphomicrobiales bacterium]